MPRAVFHEIGCLLAYMLKAQKCPRAWLAAWFWAIALAKAWGSLCAVTSGAEPSSRDCLSRTVQRSCLRMCAVCLLPHDSILSVSRSAVQCYASVLAESRGQGERASAVSYTLVAAHRSLRWPRQKARLLLASARLQRRRRRPHGSGCAATCGAKAPCRIPRGSP